MCGSAPARVSVYKACFSLLKATAEPECGRRAAFNKSLSLGHTVQQARHQSDKQHEHKSCTVFSVKVREEKKLHLGRVTPDFDSHLERCLFN